MKNFGQSEINNLEKGIELLQEDMANANSKRHMFYIHSEPVDTTKADTKITTHYHGDPTMLAAIMCSLEDEFIQELCTHIYAIKTYDDCLISYNINKKQFNKIERTCKNNKNNQQQELPPPTKESLKPKRETWLIRFFQSLRSLRG